MAEVDDYCCVIDRNLHELLEEAERQEKQDQVRGLGYQLPQFYRVAHINEAEKLSEGGSSFIAYTIVYGDYEVKRRYSEFESLRTCLCRLYPTFIIPPIPEKHSIAQYAVLQKRAKEDQYIIERRKRMLEHFINRLIEHPILSSEHIVHRFFESGVSWTEVLHSPIITNLPKSPLHSSPSKSPGSSIAPDGGAVQSPKIAATNSCAADVPVPSSLAPIRNVEARWMDCELFTNKYATQFGGVIEKSERRIFKKLGELSADYAELGAALNGFSLLENHDDNMAAAIEKAGQASDSSYIEIGNLLTQMEADVSEPIHEYSQYGNIVKKLLRFRMLKNLQVDTVQDSLARQRKKLDNLLQADDEAKKLAQALENTSQQNEHTEDQSGPSAVDSDYASRQNHQQHGFVTPQAAQSDASSSHYADDHQGTTRSRGESFSSVMTNSSKAARRRSSAAYQPEFTPTLAPHSIPEDSEIPTISSASPQLGANGGNIDAQQRPFGRRNSASSGFRSESIGIDDVDEDDILARFQQEESTMWGGGAGSTLPRPRARSRVQNNSQQTRASGDGFEYNAANGSPTTRGAGMSQSVFVSNSNNNNSNNIDVPRGSASVYQNHSYTQRRNANDLSRGNLDTTSESPVSNANIMAASEPLLSDAGQSASSSLGRRQQQHSTVATTTPSSARVSTSAGSFGSRLLRSPKTLGDGIMSRLTYALNGMMDVDPEQMRRNQIGRSSNKIGMLEEQLEMLSNDLTLINTSTQDNLDRFQKQKVKDLKAVMVSVARIHLEWAEKNLEFWRDAKEAADQV